MLIFPLSWQRSSSSLTCWSRKDGQILDVKFRARQHELLKRKVSGAQAHPLLHHEVQAAAALLTRVRLLDLQGFNELPCWGLPVDEGFGLRPRAPKPRQAARLNENCSVAAADAILTMQAPLDHGNRMTYAPFLYLRGFFVGGWSCSNSGFYCRPLCEMKPEYWRNLGTLVRPHGSLAQGSKYAPIVGSFLKHDAGCLCGVHGLHTTAP